MQNQIVNYRTAELSDVPQLHVVRCAVHENRLSRPDKVTAAHYHDHLTRLGRGWVCEVNGLVEGFAIVDLVNRNVWALFVMPHCEGNGIGKTLQRLMLDWYFEQTDAPLSLSTEPGTRAALFYTRTGWTLKGKNDDGELIFEMKKETGTAGNTSV